tara:strand:+ start:80 stop:676 length:597 start_codon:yes stop_codon:yes gene_type:complete
MIVLEYPFFSIEECEEIKRYAYKKEVELKEKITTNEYNNSITTNNYNQYNFLKDNPIYADRLVNLLKEKNCPIEWPSLVQSWVNIYRKGDGIGWHNHQGNGFSFNIFIDGDPSPGPVYLSTGYDCGLDKYEMKGANFKNKKGDIQLFRSSTHHKVDPVSSERISVGGTLQNYSDISKDFLKSLSFNNKKESDFILLSE